jgi:hypothetical protein
MNVIKLGAVFTGAKSPNVHSEIIRIYTDNGKRMVDVDQYGATLANKDWNKKATFFASEIRRALNRGTADIILVR